MIKPILVSGDKVLRTVSKPIEKIDKKVLSLISDLKDTLVVQKEPEGVGLAAPQIGKNLRVFVMMPDKVCKVIINPEIISISKSTKAPTKKLAKKHKKIMEGCLSLPNYYTPLERPFFIKIKYSDETGKEIVEEFEGVDAQIVQHEIDHLDGKLFIDRMFEQKKTLYEYNKGEWSEVEL
jgi:peptide deformylase